MNDLCLRTLFFLRTNVCKGAFLSLWSFLSPAAFAQFELTLKVYGPGENDAGKIAAVLPDKIGVRIRTDTQNNYWATAKIDSNPIDIVVPEDAGKTSSESSGRLNCDFLVMYDNFVPFVHQASMEGGTRENVPLHANPRSKYRALATKGVVRPLSDELKRLSDQLDPKLHQELVDELLADAKREKALEQQKLSLILPAYIYPSDEGSVKDKNNLAAKLNNADWQTIQRDLPRLKQRGVDSWVIFNPSNGPGNDSNPLYAAKIAVIAKLNAIPVGYVSLGSGVGQARVYESVESVKNQIDRWLRLYPKIEGFFMDTCPTSEESFQSVDEMVKHARSKSPKCRVIINPGTVPSRPFLKSDFVDVICALESNQGAELLENAPTPQTKYAAILWNSKFEPQKEIEYLRPLGFSCFYVTDRNDDIDLDGKPGTDASAQWGRLPSPKTWNGLMKALIATPPQPQSLPIANDKSLKP